MKLWVGAVPALLVGLVCMPGCGGDAPVGDGDAGGGLDAASSDGGPGSDATVVPDAPTGIDAPVACAAPRVECGADCADLQTDARHCGDCGRACGTGQTRKAGSRRK